jgi:hypothetical protein
MTNVRRRKNYIHSLHTSEGLVVTQAQKYNAIFNHFKLHNGTYLPRICTLNFSELGWEPRNLSHLDLPFTEDEVKRVILDAPKEKALGQMDSLAFSFLVAGRLYKMTYVKLCSSSSS